MRIIQKLISTHGELKLPISAGAFESALQHNTCSATSEDDISGHTVKFDAEDYVQTFYGRISGGQFQLRPVRKGKRLEMENFLINGSYEPEAGGASVRYTLSLNPKATVLWLLVIVLFFVQLVLAQTFAMKGPNIFTFYAVAVPIGGLGWIAYRFRNMLQPAKRQFEGALHNLTDQATEAVTLDSTPSPSLRSILGTLIFMGTVFSLVGIGLGLFTYLKAGRTTEAAVGTVVELRGNGKAYYPVISYTTKDGIERTYESNYGSNPPINVIGDTVRIYYDPAEPNRARVDNATESWLFPFNFGLCGIAFLIIAGLGYRNRSRALKTNKF